MMNETVSDSMDGWWSNVASEQQRALVRCFWFGCLFRCFVARASPLPVPSHCSRRSSSPPSWRHLGHPLHLLHLLLPHHPLHPLRPPPPLPPSLLLLPPLRYSTPPFAYATRIGCATSGTCPDSRRRPPTQAAITSLPRVEKLRRVTAFLPCTKPVEGADGKVSPSPSPSCRTLAC